MKLEVIRFNKGKDSTNGILFNTTNERKFLCYTLEDESRTEKVWGETCIPEGEYCLGLRTVGGIMLSTLKGFLTSIWGCFTYLMSLILNTFLFIAAILTKILLDVCYWVIRKKTITSKKTDSLDDLPKPTSASTKTSRKRSKAGKK